MRYIGAIRLGLKESIAYRFEAGIWSVIAVLNIAFWFFLWTAIFSISGAEQIRGFTLQDMINYYLIMTIILWITFSWVDEEITRKVHDGTLLSDVLRPAKLYTIKFFKHIGNKGSRFLLQVIPLSLIAVFIFKLTTTPLHFFFFLISFLLGLILTFNFIYLFGLSAFWLTKTSGIFQIRRGLQDLLEGYLLPLTLFPAIVQTAFAFLPFQYMSFVPAQIFLQKYTLLQALQNIGLQIVWIIILYALILVVWNKAKKKFESVGT